MLIPGKSSRSKKGLDPMESLLGLSVALEKGLDAGCGSRGFALGVPAGVVGPCWLAKCHAPEDREYFLRMESQVALAMNSVFRPLPPLFSIRVVRLLTLAPQYLESERGTKKDGWHTGRYFFHVVHWRE